MARLPIPGSDDGTWGDVLNQFLGVSHNADGTLSSSAVTTAGALASSQLGQPNGAASLDAAGRIPSAQFGNTITATVYDKGGQVYSVKAYGAKGDGSTNDTAAIQAAINAAQTAHGTVFVDTGTYNVTAPLNITSEISFVGTGDGSQLVATAAVAEVLNITVGGAGRGLFKDFRVNGNNLATNCVNQSITTETSVGTRYVRVRCSGATSYQFVNDKCEDVSYTDCLVDGNESAPSTTPYALQVTVPGGAIRIIGGEWFGRCDLSYQQIGIFGAVIGPIFIENSNANNDTVLYAAGCYMYDGGPISNACIDTGTNLTNIVLDGCYMVAQSQLFWINGNIPAYVSIEANNCIWVHGSAGTVGACSLLQASGSGTFSVTGGSTVLLSGDTLALFKPVASATTIARMPVQCIGVPAYSQALPAPAVPASGTAHTNTFASAATVYVTGGTVSSIAVGGTSTGQTAGAFYVQPSQSITLTYTAAPTWTWFAQ